MQLSAAVRRPCSDHPPTDPRGVLRAPSPAQPPTHLPGPPAPRARSVALVALLGSGDRSAPAARARSLPPTARRWRRASSLGGHARIGSWMAISVHLVNDGPPITGELRLAGGTQGQTRFGTPVDLPTQSDKTYVLYAQPPAFGSELKVDLVDGDATIATTQGRRSRATTRPSSSSASSPSAPSGIVGGLAPARRTMNGVAPLDPQPDPGRPARPRRGVGRARPARSGRTSKPSRLSPAQLAGAARLGRRRRPPRHRRRDGRTGSPVGLPGRAPALPAGGHDRRPGREPERPARPAADGRDARSRPCPASSSRAGRSRRSATASSPPSAPYGSGVGHAPRLRPGGGLDRQDRHAQDVLWRRLLPARTVGGRSLRRRQHARQRGLATAVAGAPADRRADRLLLGYILLIGPINYLSCAGSTSASGRGSRCRPSSWSSPSGRTGSGPPCAAAS